MFNSSQRKPSGAHAGDTSLVASGTLVNGEMHFSGALHLDGQVEGAVIADDGSGAVFTLSAEGIIKGDVRVPVAVINGTVKGNIHTSDRLELASQARVEGDVHYRVLEMAAGAEVNGRIVHHGGEERRQLTGPEDVLDADDEDVAPTASVPELGR